MGKARKPLSEAEQQALARAHHGDREAWGPELLFWEPWGADDEACEAVWREPGAHAAPPSTRCYRITLKVDGVGPQPSIERPLSLLLQRDSGTFVERVWFDDHPLRVRSATLYPQQYRLELRLEPV